MEDKNKSGASSDQEQEAQTEEKEETTSPDAVQDKNESEESEEEVGSEDSEGAIEEIDYKAELEKKEEQIKQAEHTIVDLKRDKKDKEKEEEEAEEEKEKEDVGERISQEVKKQVSVARQEMVQDTIDEVIDSSSDNPDERKLIKWNYENSIRPTGFSRQAILDDIGRAKLLANEKKLIKENSELRVALKAKSTTSNLSQCVNQDTLKLDDTDKKFTKEELSRFNRIAKGDSKKYEELKRKALIRKSAGSGEKIPRS